MTIRLPDEVARELGRLRTRVVELEAELKRRDEIIEASVQRLRRRLNLTVGEARMVVLLSDGNAHSREQLIDAHEGYIECDRAIDSHMKRIRKKGELTIRTDYGLGYSLAPKSLELVRAILRDESTFLTKEASIQ